MTEESRVPAAEGSHTAAFKLLLLLEKKLKQRVWGKKLKRRENGEKLVLVI